MPTTPQEDEELARERQNERNRDFEDQLRFVHTVDRRNALVRALLEINPNMQIEASKDMRRGGAASLGITLKDHYECKVTVHVTMYRDFSALTFRGADRNALHPYTTSIPLERVRILVVDRKEHRLMPDLNDPSRLNTFHTHDPNFADGRWDAKVYASFVNTVVDLLSKKPPSY